MLHLSMIITRIERNSTLEGNVANRYGIEVVTIPLANRTAGSKSYLNSRVTFAAKWYQLRFDIVMDLGSGASFRLSNLYHFLADNANKTDFTFRSM